jgi:hypothetical protein
VRIEGTIASASDIVPADQHPEYVAKYLERISALFGTPGQFATLFTTALVITPTKLYI